MSVTARDLTKLNPQELIALKAEIAKIETARQTAQVDLRAYLQSTEAKLAQLVQAAGMAMPVATPHQVITPKAANNGNGTHKATPKKAKRKGRKLPIKYRDPANPRHVWTGRGKLPDWITQSGKGKEAFRVTA